MSMTKNALAVRLNSAGGRGGGATNTIGRNSSMASNTTTPATTARDSTARDTQQAVALSKDPNTARDHTNAPTDPLFPLLDINRNLQVLYQVAWNCLRCRTADELADKIFQCEKISSSLSSALQFSQDEYGIWQGDVRRPGQEKLPPPWSPEGMGSTDTATVSDYLSIVPTEPQFSISSDVLPINLQLRPVDEKTTLSFASESIFRLFFYDNQLVTVTQCNPWVFYPEIHQQRQHILVAIKSYASSNAVRYLLKQYSQRANADALKQAPHTPSAAAGPARRMSMSPSQPPKGRPTPLEVLPPISARKTDPRLTGDRTGGCLSLYAPAPQHCFADILPPRLGADGPASDLSSEQVLANDKQYRFLSKITSWRNLVKKAQQNLIAARRTGGAAAARSKPMVRRTSDQISALMCDVSGAVSAEAVEKQATSYITFPDNSQFLGVDLVEQLYASSKPPDAVGTDPEAEVIYSRDEVSVRNYEANLRRALTESYLGRLKEIAIDTDSSIAGRLRLPVANPGEVPSSMQAARGLEQTSRSLDLIVLEVRVDISRNASGQGQGGTALANSRSTKTGSAGSGYKQDSNSHQRPPVIQRQMLKSKKMPSKGPNGNGNDSPGKPLDEATATVSQTSERGDRDENGSRTTIDMPHSGPPTQRLLPVELHQIVGIFDCSRETCPPSLDLGMIEWSHFRNLHNDAEHSRKLEWQKMIEMREATELANTQNSHNLASLDDISAIASVASSKHSHQKKKEKNFNNWSKPDEASGLSVFRGDSAAGHHFHMYLMAAPSTREFHEKVLPKSVRRWIRMDTDND